jgi:hypothetical protein
MIKNLNSVLNKNNTFNRDASRRGVEGSPRAVGRRICGGGPYGEKPLDYADYVNH